MAGSYVESLCIDANPEGLLDQLRRYQPPTRDKWTPVGEAP